MQGISDILHGKSRFMTSDERMLPVKIPQGSALPRQDRYDGIPVGPFGDGLRSGTEHPVNMAVAEILVKFGGGFHRSRLCE